MPSRYLRIALLATPCAALAIAAPGAAAAPPGDLSQLAGESGCVHDDDSGVPATDLGCDEGNSLVGAASTTVSPDGENVYVASQVMDAVAVFSRDPGSGALTQLPGTAGCVSETGNGGDCTNDTALDGASSVAITPDGKFAYVASVDSDAVGVFTRNQDTGALTQVPGNTGCVSETGSNGNCGDGKVLDGADSVAVSPDGKTVYVTSTISEGVAVFSRNESSGWLFQLSDPNGCVKAVPMGTECSVVPLLDGAESIAVSPDASSAYIASEESSDAVLAFSRTQASTPSQGSLTFLSCVSETGSTSACADGRGLDGARSVTVTADGDSVYAASNTSDAVAVFSRDENTFGLDQPDGPAGCVSETGSGGDCADGKALDGANSVTASPDGRNVYATSRVGSDAAVAFSRDQGTSALTQLAGTAGCVSLTGSAGECEDGRALDDPTSIAVSPDGKSAYATAESIGGHLAVFAREQDADFDSVGDSEDNCPGVSNTGQQNTDADAEGDACDASPAGPGSGVEAAPVADQLAVVPSRFRARRRGPSLTARLGATVSYRLTKAAAVSFTVERARPGRRSGGRCVAPNRRNRNRRRCTRFVALRGGFTHQGSAGPNSFRFTGRLNGRRLPPAAYRLVGEPTDALGNRGEAARARFRIVRR